MIGVNFNTEFKRWKEKKNEKIPEYFFQIVSRL